MKLIINFVKIAALLFLLVICTFSAYDFFSGYQFEHSFKQVKVGMSAGEVVNILGKPEQINYGDDSLTHVYWYSSGVMGKSTEPSVTFDTTNKVVRAWYGD